MKHGSFICGLSTTDLSVVLFRDKKWLTETQLSSVEQDVESKWENWFKINKDIVLLPPLNSNMIYEAPSISSHWFKLDDSAFKRPLDSMGMIIWRSLCISLIFTNQCFEPRPGLWIAYNSVSDDDLSIFWILKSKLEQF